MGTDSGGGLSPMQWRRKNLKSVLLVGRSDAEFYLKSTVGRSSVILPSRLPFRSALRTGIRCEVIRASEYVNDLAPKSAAE
jgi:hypothetical protein